MNENCTILHLAIVQNKKDVVEYLLKNGADPNIRTSYFGSTASHLVIEKNLPEIRDLLLNNKKVGIDPNIQDNFGRNLIHYAIEKERIHDNKEYTNNTIDYIKSLIEVVQFV